MHLVMTKDALPTIDVVTAAERTAPSGSVAQDGTTAPATGALESPARLIAFYLPQYHPIPENDAWWGHGFTEWTNVTKGRPLFRGHYQPHLPAHLGFYDLRLPEVRRAQAELARQHGIDAFCYYHYWFNGRRILERPFSEVLSSGQPDHQFCLCWANENWTRAWDGGESEILLEQKYDLDDDRRHIRHLFPAFRDRRYLRVEGKPVFLVYRTELLPFPARTAEIWREEARKAGIGELYLIRVESFWGGIDPAGIGFDAAVEFAPDWRNMGKGKYDSLAWRIRRKLRLAPTAIWENRVLDYECLVKAMSAKREPSFTWFRCVCPSFDNSPRRRNSAVIYHNATPKLYKDWLSVAIRHTMTHRRPEERLVFINAWNEWGEGSHLEPDQRWGLEFLKATRDAKDEVSNDCRGAAL